MRCLPVPPRFIFPAWYGDWSLGKQAYAKRVADEPRLRDTEGDEYADLRMVYMARRLKNVRWSRTPTLG